MRQYAETPALPTVLFVSCELCTVPVPQKCFGEACCYIQLMWEESCVLDAAVIMLVIW